MKTINDVRKSLNALLEELDKMEAEQGVKLIPAPEWGVDNLKVGELYWFVHDNDCVQLIKWSNDDEDKFNHVSGNVFETAEDAYNDYKMRKLAQSIRTQGFKPDWSDVTQGKYYTFFDYCHNEIRFDRCWTSQSSRTYFKTEEIAQSAFEGVSNEDFIYMLERGYV